MTESLSRAGIPSPIHADDIGKYGERLQLTDPAKPCHFKRKPGGGGEEWLKQGRDLLLTSDTGLYDAQGGWKGAGALYEDMGIRVCGKGGGITGSDGDNWMVHDSHTYLDITQPAIRYLAYAGHTAFALRRQAAGNRKRRGHCSLLAVTSLPSHFIRRNFPGSGKKAGKRLFMPENWKAVPGWYISRRILTAAMPDTIYRIHRQAVWRAR